MFLLMDIEKLSLINLYANFSDNLWEFWDGGYGVGYILTLGSSAGVVGLAVAG